METIAHVQLDYKILMECVDLHVEYMSNMLIVDANVYKIITVLAMVNAHNALQPINGIQSWIAVSLYHHQLVSMERHGMVAIVFVHKDMYKSSMYAAKFALMVKSHLIMENVDVKMDIN